MIENLIKASTCKIFCGEELGTGFLVAEKLVLTARHCVTDAIENHGDIKLSFPDIETDISAVILSESDELDVCLLTITDNIDLIPITFNDELPREGSDWYAFGYPRTKRAFGHRISGSVLQVLNEPKLKIDLDLEVDASVSLSQYDGMSGTALICEGECRGVMRLKTDRTLGAISSSQIQKFLKNNEIEATQNKNNPSKSSMAERADFQSKFEKKLEDCKGKYLFLSGSNGIGKSTFCARYQAFNTSLFVLGTYSFSSDEQGSGIAFRTQPNVFFDWFSTLVSMQLSGETARQDNKPFAVLVKETESLLNDFSDYCQSQERHGVIFIDGLNEAQTVSEEIYSQFIGLFPLSLPSCITVVFTAPNFENIAVPLEGRVHIEDQIQLPVLDNDVVRSYCISELREERVTIPVIRRICQKSQGHPLYLRYLIEFVNTCSAVEALEEFPEFSGVIGEYYEQVWGRLLSDQDAVNLLALLSRLRWGINLETLPKVLTSSEQSVLVSTLSRIRHLLANENETTIYHSSFAEFLSNKTSQLDNIIEERLSNFCIQNSEIDYCIVNSVFHSLRSGNEGIGKAIQICTQNWVNQCVFLGVEPDTLLFDIENVLEAVVKIGSTVDVVRILLLSQRINFRYNTLFTQSSYLVSEALIALDKPKEAFQHAVRFNNLVVHPEDALEITQLLIDKNYENEANELLTLLSDSIHHMLFTSKISILDYVGLCQIYIQSLLLTGLIDERRAVLPAAHFVVHAIKSIRRSAKGVSESELQKMTAPLQCALSSFTLCFYEQYPGIAAMKERGMELPDNIMLDSLAGTLQYSSVWLGGYKKLKNNESLPKVFSDIEELLSTGSCFNDSTASSIVDILIQTGAPLKLIQSVAKAKKLPDPFKIVDKNGVDVDFQRINLVEQDWRISTFLYEDIECPHASSFEKDTWLESLECILAALYWCEGRSLRGKSENDDALLKIAFDNLQSNVLEPLEFTLKERALWENSYFIPEEILPKLYEKLTELHIECFPDKLPSFLNTISKRFSLQLGIYSEGFREVVYSIINQLTSELLDLRFSDEIFKILQQWKRFVIDNVDNRHELVPELLRMIPLFVKVDAKETSEQLYKQILDVSMGPNWYKEDQFGLMLCLLQTTDKINNDKSFASQIGGYLERSCGEMTFQRFVRYDKTELIEKLTSQKKYSQVMKYFKRQTCGELPELLEEASKGNIDRISPLKGIRYPGGGLDEQHAILNIIRNVDVVEWRICWAILEIYLFGDERHVADYAKEFAKLVNNAKTESDSISQMVKRTELLVNSELSLEQYDTFLVAFKNTLEIQLHNNFSEIFDLISDLHFDSDNGIEASLAKETELRDEDNDAPLMPGTFGSKSSIKQANIVLTNAESKLSRGNIQEAKRLAVNALNLLQRGGWSIWGNLSGESRRMMEIIQEDESSANEITRYYAPLLLEERFEPRWRLAEHLILKCFDKLDEHETAALTQSVMEHIQLMVGDAQNDIDTFKFLDEDKNSDLSTELFNLLIWLIDHPQWLRQEKAASMLAWLLEKDCSYLEMSISIAFSMQNGFGPDVICGVLDGISQKQPLKVWSTIKPHLRMNETVHKCMHASRLAILYRIAERAAQEGSKSASKIASEIEERMSPEITQPTSHESHYSLPNYAQCIETEWNDLVSLGFINSDVVSCFTKEMDSLCSPLDVETARDLEEVVSMGFRVNLSSPLNRWEAKVYFALNVALFRGKSITNALKVDSVIRVFNPSTLWLTQRAGNVSRANKILDVLRNNDNPMLVINDGHSTLLNYQEVINHEDINHGMQIDIIAVVTSNYNGYQPNIPGDNSLFSSTSYINEIKGVPDYETCYRVDPVIAFLGSFTPAIPTTSFLKLTGAKQGNFIRKNWKEGRSSDPVRSGRPLAEGCLLAVKLNALRLPTGYKLAWIFKVNGEISGIFH